MVLTFIPDGISLRETRSPVVEHHVSLGLVRVLCRAPLSLEATQNPGDIRKSSSYNMNLVVVVRTAGVEPARACPRDFKSLASTSFATSALVRRLSGEGLKRKRVGDR